MCGHKPPQLVATTAHNTTLWFYTFLIADLLICKEHGLHDNVWAYSEKMSKFLSPPKVGFTMIHSVKTSPKKHISLPHLFCQNVKLESLTFIFYQPGRKKQELQTLLLNVRILNI